MCTLIIDNKENKRNKWLCNELLSKVMDGIEYTLLSQSEVPKDRSKLTSPIICLGMSVFESIIKQTKVKRGTSRWLDGKRYIPTYSLNEVFNKPKYFLTLYRDLRIPNLYPVTTAPTDEHELIYRIPTDEELRESQLISFDLETTNLNPRKGNILLIGIGVGNKAYIIDEENLLDHERIKKIFDNKEWTWVCQNGKFDVRWLINHYNTRPYVTHDTMILHYILDERFPHGLKEQAQERLGVRNYDADLKPYLKNKRSSYAAIPHQILCEYAARDIIYTLQLFTSLWKELQDHEFKESLTKAYIFTMEAADALIDLEENGMLLDMPSLLKKEKELETLAADFLTKIKDLSQTKDFNPNSPQQVAIYLYDKRKYKNPNIELSKTGRPTGAKTLAKIKQSHPEDEFLTVLTEYKQVTKLLSTYIRPFKEKVDSDGRLRTTYRCNGPETGRLSSIQPNFQNIPRTSKNKFSEGIRSLFIAPKGKKFIFADYSQAELRILAILSLETGMRDVWLSGLDIHTEQARDMYKLGDKDPSKEQRTAAKTINFSIAYGITAYKLALDLNVSVQTATKLLDAFFESRPNLYKWITEKRKEATESDQIISQVHTRNGRIRRFGLVTPLNVKDVEKQAGNMEPQSLAADSCTQSVIWINKWLKRRNLGKLIITVHDSIGIECDESLVDYIEPRVKYIMYRAGLRITQSDFVPLKVDVDIKDKWE